MPDDFAPNPTTTGRVTVGAAPTVGQIETGGDDDWFGVDLQANVPYQFDLSRTAGNGIADPYLRFYGATGILLATDDDSGGNLNSRLRFVPTQTGRYFLSATEFSASGVGGYQVSASIFDDYAASTQTTGTIAVGSTRTGEIEAPADVDWFRTTLTAGSTYLINLYGSPSSQGSLDDPVIAGVYDANGTLLSGTFNDDGGNSTEAVLRFTAPTTGTYYIAADAYGTYTGTYTLRLDLDDYADNVGTTGRVVVGGSSTGTINTAGDRDWFAVTLTAGNIYTADLRGAPSNLGNLADPYLRGIYDSAGVLITGTSNDDFGGGREARATFAPTVSGTYYIAAGAFSTGTGSYTLSVSGQANTDIAASAATTASIVVGAIAHNVVDQPGDVDWFRTTLTAGQTYAVELNADLSAFNALPDPLFAGIYDASGTLVPGTTNDDYGISRNSRVTFIPTASGTYYLAASAYGANIGAYTLSLAITAAAADTAGNTPATAQTLALATSVTAAIDPIRDVDWYGVSLAANQNYVVNQRGLSSGAGSLTDPEILGIYDASGAIIPGTGNDNSGGSLDAQTSFQPLSAGTYYIGVSAHSDITGTYSIRIDSAAASTDLPANAVTPATLLVGGVLRSDIGFAGDVDWVRTSLVAGTVYQVNQLGSATQDGSLADPLIVGVYNAAGQALSASGDDDSGVGANALVTVTAPVTGTYYIAAAAYGSNIGSYTLSLTAANSDTAPPVLRSTSPSDNAAAVPVRTNITMEFNEAVRAGSGNILITSGSAVRTIAVTDTAQVTFSGNTLTVSPSADLAPATDYSVTLAPGVVRDLAGNSFAGISAATDFNFRTAPTSTNDDWTILIYVAGDNNLEAAAIADINEMESVALGSNVNVVVLVDRAPGYDTSNGNWTDTRSGLITHDTSLATISSNLTSLGELNTGAAATLTNFINASVAANPANRYALVVWDHGGGLSGTAWDDTSGGDNLSLQELHSAVAASVIGGFDLIAFDTCLQGMVEQVWDLRGLAGVVVASQELVPGDGFEYDVWLDAVRRNPTLTALDMSTAMVDAYRQRYAGEANTTLSSTRESAVTALGAALDQFAVAAIDYGSAAITGLRTAAARTTAIDGGQRDYRDLGDFMRQVMTFAGYGDISAAANRVLTALNTAEVARTGTVANANGLSVYLPTSSIRSDYNSQAYAFLQGTAWGSFLRFMLQDTANDVITGDSGDNFLYGFGGGDRLNGLDGDDRLVGGADNDYLTGGNGADTFMFAVSGNGLDTISDWGDGDQIFIANIMLAGPVTAGGSAVGGYHVQVSSANGATDLWIDTNGVAGAEMQIRLLGTETAANLVLTATAEGTRISRPVNLAPLLSAPLADAAISAGGAFSYYVAANAFTDPTNDALTLTAQQSNGLALPAWLTFNAASRTFTGSPTGAQVGVTQVRVRAADSAGGSAFDDFDLVVAPQGFNGLNYIASYADLRAAFGTNSLLGTRHYVTGGATEGRTVSFDPARYVAAYGDLIIALGTDSAAAARHYIQTGANEGRNLRFDGRAYWAMNAAARREAGRDQTGLAHHYIALGAAQGAPTTLDALRYIASYRDLMLAFGTNTAAASSHFFASGFNEGRAVTFNSLAYVASYSDLMAAFSTNGQVAAQHYINTGWAEGRRTSFDPLRYTASYRDLITTFGTNQDAAAAHFITAGRFEGRQATFDARQYWAMSQAARAEAGTDTTALTRLYISRGSSEGAASQLDPLRYIASYGDLITTFRTNSAAGLSHFLASGYAEGRTATFDALRYLASNADLIAAFHNDTAAATRHYINVGNTEGRSTTSFSALQYVLANADVRAVTGLNADAATTHYIVSGRAEGRQAVLANLSGTANADTLAGGAAAELLSGGAGNDMIFGNGGSDLISGGSGADVLWGGDGADVFSFVTTAEGGDSINDFTSGIDTLLFSSTGFGGLAEGRLDASRLGSSSAELGTRSGFVYDFSTGSLAFDPDGAGLLAAIPMASLGPGRTLRANDIVIGG